jgi:hypothetical protein
MLFSFVQKINLFTKLLFKIYQKIMLGEIRMTVVSFRAREELFFATISRPALGITLPHIQPISRALSPQHEPNHLPHSIADV